MELIFIVFFAFSWYTYARLKLRVEDLERRLGMENRTGTVIPPHSVIPQQFHAESVSVSTPLDHGTVAQSEGMLVQENASAGDSEQMLYRDRLVRDVNALQNEVDIVEKFMSWLKKDFLMKIGALFLLMGMGWFVSYAFMNNWVGPMGRILLGLLTGMGILILGAWRIRTYEHQGAVFMVLGSGTVLLTTFAARAMYDFFTPVSALLLMFATVLFVAYVSVKYRRNSLALACLIIAGIAPYLTFSPVPLVIEQFMYLFVVVLGTLWVVYFTGWRNLTLTALIIVFLETLPFIERNEDSSIVLLWVFLFIAIFFVANIVSIIRVAGSALSKPHLLTAFGTALFLILWVFGIAPQEWQSLLFVAWMLVFSFGSYIVYMTTAERIPFYVYGGTSIALLAAATTAELDGTVLTIAYLFEVAILVIMAQAIMLERQVITSLSTLFAIPMILSLENISAYSWNTGIIHADFFVVVFCGLILSLVGLFVYEKSNSEAGKMCGSTLITFGVLYGLMLIWLVLHALLSTDTATMCSLVVYTIFGVTVLFMGKARDNRGFAVAGWALIGFVVGRLLLVDVWAMDLTGRIITFLVIGVLLISTAFMGKTKDNDQTSTTT